MLNNNNNQCDIQLSKFLSYILRHGAEKEKLIIESDGFADVATLLKNSWFNQKKITTKDIERIVKNNNKNRFTLIVCEQTGHLKIKANQGHSLKNVSNLKLYEFKTAEELPILIHGTYLKFWEHIKLEGLKCMNRNHIHFTYTDNITANSGSKKISGFRENSQILIYIDVNKAMNDGIKFFKSENNVILSSGINNIIEKKYFFKVIDRNSKTILF